MGRKKTKIIFFSTECYPAAKAGGLGDVVGSLPKYINKQNAEVRVVIPKYSMPWIDSQDYKILHEGEFVMGAEHLTFSVQYVQGDPLGFPLIMVDIPGKFDRYGVYAGEDGHFFSDEVERYIAFSRAVMDWIKQAIEKPDIIHCHDHHTGLIPFMAKYCYDYRDLAKIPTVFTIHNERYQGTFGWDRQYLIPEFDTWKAGLLDWGNRINPLASAVKCAWKVTTVSPSYMEELTNNSFGLEWLFQSENEKCMGILNGIDSEYWNPRQDELLAFPLKKSIEKFKRENKKALLHNTPLDQNLPLVSFIGRLALEKGADFMPGLIDRFLSRGEKVQFLVLGTGDKTMENHLLAMGQKFPSQTKIYIAYNEKLAHQIYAGSDFLIMPSRVEPCGLNQMYSMRYGTIPIVHNIGGLKDSVVDIKNKDGSGIKIDNLNAKSIDQAVQRSIDLYNDQEKFFEIIGGIMKLDFSWEASAEKYLEMYNSLL